MNILKKYLRLIKGLVVKAFLLAFRFFVAVQRVVVRFFRILLTNAEESTSYEYKQDLDKAFKALSLLFEPFRTTMLGVLPRSKPIVKLFDAFGRLIKRIVEVFFIFGYVAFNFLKGKGFRIIIILLLVIFILSSILSRVLNSQSYRLSFENAILKSTGYQTRINGFLKFSFFPTPRIFFNNVEFIKKENGFVQKLDDGGKIQIQSFRASKVSFKFKLLPIFLGKLEVDKMAVEGMDIVLKTSELNKSNYNNQVKIENIVTNALKQVEGDNNFAGNDVLNNWKAGNTKTQKFQSSFSEKDFRVYNENKQGFFTSFLASIVGNVKISPDVMNRLYIKRSAISIITPQETELVKISNLSAMFDKSLLNKIKMVGNFNVGDTVLFFKVELRNRRKGREYKVYSEFSFTKKSLELDQGIFLKGNYSKEFNKGYFSLRALGSDARYLLSFVYGGLDNAKIDNNVAIAANVVVSPVNLTLSNYKVMFKDNEFFGKVYWDYGLNNVINASVNFYGHNLYKEIAKYNENRRLVTSNVFDDLMDRYILFSRNTFSKMQPDFIIFDVNIKKLTVIKKEINNSFHVRILETPSTLYIDSLKFDDDNFSLKANGFMNIDLKRLVLNMNMNVKPSQFAKAWGFNNNFQDFVSKIDGGSEINIAGQGIFATNKAVMSDVNISFNGQEYKNAYIGYEQRVAGSNLALSLKEDFIDISNIMEVFNIQKIDDRLSGSDVFGVPNKLNLSFNIEAERGALGPAEFRNVKFKGNIFRSGYNIDNFELKDANGVVYGSLNFNRKVMPNIIGNIFFDKYSLDASWLNGFLFDGYNFKSDIFLDGRLEFKGNNYAAALRSLTGDIAFNKKERVLTGRKNNSQGLYLTFTSGEGNTININDIYGQIKVINGIFDIYPGIFVYLNAGKQTRGQITGDYNLNTDMLNLSGNYQVTQKSKRLTKGIEIKGNAKNPSFKTSNVFANAKYKNREMESLNTRKDDIIEKERDKLKNDIRRASKEVDNVRREDKINTISDTVNIAKDVKAAKDMGTKNNIVDKTDEIDKEKIQNITNKKSVDKYILDNEQSRKEQNNYKQVIEIENAKRKQNMQNRFLPQNVKKEQAIQEKQEKEKPKLEDAEEDIY